jgi:hypothetical protein
MDEQNMIFLESFQNYYYSGNIPVAMIVSNQDVEVQIVLNVPVKGDIIDITELHTPDWSYFGWQGVVYLDLAALMTSRLSSIYPPSPYETGDYFDYSDIYVQQISGGEVTIKVNGAVVKTFVIIKGTVDKQKSVSDFNFFSYIQNNLLSLCPQIRYVHPEMPNVLNVYAFGLTTIYAKAKIQTGFNEEGEQTFSYEEVIFIETPLYENSLLTFNARFNAIVTVCFNAQWVLNQGADIVHIDLYSKDQTTEVETTPVRLIPNKTTFQYADIFAFENSLGGIDIVRFTGVLSENIDHEYLSFKNNNYNLEYDTLPNIQFEKNTGFLESREDLVFASDFLSSMKRYHYSNGEFKRIYITNKKATYQRGSLTSFTFTFAYAKQQHGFLLNRKESL